MKQMNLFLKSNKYCVDLNNIRIDCIINWKTEIFFTNLSIRLK